jgi:tRNA A-37 threonylcarbamoyl transferase component Bud32
MESRGAVSPSACVGENTLTAFIEGALFGEALSRVTHHLTSCDSCGGIVEHALASLKASTLRGGFRPSESAVANALLPGSRVGRYRVLEVVGAGAMGTVYAAHDPDLDRRVALKILRSNARGDQLRARLSREAKAMARLSHPNVITVYDVGTLGAQLFVAMEFVAGGTLREWLTQRPRGWAEVLSVLVRAGRGLACAHAAGLVHRDFKPDNVLVGDDGRVRVTDFGLARALRDEQPATGREGDPLEDLLETTITRTGTLVGTPAYMAPEQLRGEPAAARADTFSFCVTLYEALHGERPYGGATVASLRSETAAGVVRPAPSGCEVPGRVRDLLLRGLRPHAEARPASLEGLLDALEAAVAAPPGTTLPAVLAEGRRSDPPADTLLPVAVFSQRHGVQKPLWALAGTGAVLVALLGFGVQRRAAAPEVHSAGTAQPQPSQVPPAEPTAALAPPSTPTTAEMRPSPVLPAPSPRPSPGPAPTPRARLPAAIGRTAPPAAVASANPGVVAPVPPPSSAPAAASTTSARLGGDATNDRE